MQFLTSEQAPSAGYFADIYNTKIGPIPTPVLFWVGLTPIVLSGVLARTVFGRFVASVGESAEAARAGVPVLRGPSFSPTLAFSRASRR